MVKNYETGCKVCVQSDIGAINLSWSYFSVAEC